MPGHPRPGRCWLGLWAAGLLACSEVTEVLAPADEGVSTTIGSGGSGTTTGSGGSGGAGGGGGLATFVVDAGNDHSCAIRGGELYCWGGNQRGTLGLGDSQNRLSPERVGSLSSWVQVVTAADHTCALRDDGSVWCFGANDVGQLGTAGVNDVLSPLAVSLPGAAVGISSEAAFSCALLDSRALYCWGENIEGMLAQDDDYPGENQFTPVRVADFTDWMQVDTGQGHACALRLPGTLWCWGRNTGEQLGLGDDALDQYRFPQQVGELDDWTEVDAGQNHSCGLRAGSELWCWGENTHGNLGTGDPAKQTSPVRVDTRQYRQISLDTFHTCAIDMADDLWCWGRNVEGQLGLGDTIDRALPTKVPVGGWDQVSVGRFHTCAQKLDHTVWCTGRNELGELGVGDGDRRSEFSQVWLPGD